MPASTESSITIQASPAEVMAVIADLPAYTQWSDGIASVQVLSVYEDDNRAADARFQVESGLIKDTYELEYDWADDDSSVSWTLTTGQMLKALDGVYELSGPAEGPTTVVYKLAVDVSIPMIGMIKRKAEKVIVDTALRGLKERVEGTG